jgi:hypothetical protein
MCSPNSATVFPIFTGAVPIPPKVFPNYFATFPIIFNPNLIFKCLIHRYLIHFPIANPNPRPQNGTVSTRRDGNRFNYSLLAE